MTIIVNLWTYKSILCNSKQQRFSSWNVDHKSLFNSLGTRNICRSTGIWNKLSTNRRQTTVYASKYSSVRAVAAVETTVCRKCTSRCEESRMVCIFYDLGVEPYQILDCCALLHQSFCDWSVPEARNLLREGDKCFSVLPQTDFYEWGVWICLKQKNVMEYIKSQKVGLLKMLSLMFTTYFWRTVTNRNRSC